MELGTLRVITPDGQVREYPIEHESVVIGRSGGNGVVIDHVSVSRRHAQLFVTTEKVQIEDLGSANGTFVGSQRLSASRPADVGEGQPLRIGDCEARFFRPASAGIGAASASTVVSTPAPGSGDTQTTLGVALASPTVPVAPGAATTATVVVQNRGATVDQVTISVPDLPPAWVRVSRPQLTLVPGAKDEVTIVLQPPRAPEALAGDTPLAVAVVSREHKREIRVLGKFTILGFDAFALSLHPPRGTGSFEVVAENQGNSPISYTLDATQDAEALELKLSEQKVDLAPGERHTIPLKATPRKRPLFKHAPTESFRVDARPDRPGAPGGEVTGQLAEVKAPLWWWRFPAFGIPGLAVIAALAYGGTKINLSNSNVPGASALQTATAIAALVPTREPTTAAAVSPTAPAALVMRNGGNAEIINSPQGSCLNVRSQPVRTATSVGQLCDGARVRLTTDSTTADGFVWWGVTGKDATGKDLAGFAAEKPADGSTSFMKPVQ